MHTLITIIHILTCIFLVLVILLQSGKGGGVSAAFGGGASAALGQRSAGTVLTKLTGGAAALFMFTSMVLAYMSTQSDSMRDFAEKNAAEAAATSESTATPAGTSVTTTVAPKSAAPAPDRS